MEKEQIYIVCSNCGGDGMIPIYNCETDDYYDETCEMCNGEGGWWTDVEEGQND